MTKATWTTSQSEYPANADYFDSFAKPGKLLIAGGGSVNIQCKNSSGAWTTFDTATDALTTIDVANMPKIRFDPVASADYLFVWS